ncbi:rhodanese-like domain-containing protein [Nodosilinea sp. LEGE 07088]|uniref:rhodanese-like domain-containing protein n=1 Tax=Nodosilinea sp. LEGE 07088 TaxID=2777968 RepID=UPI001882FCD4|nr:rhodanese-like domain-containing protein [Nodosilinea sp. LEGE 07088]MBE9137870.1 rhodanese-like domain-containing protein [Nodosilinea sp. LEGE 07088]
MTSFFVKPPAMKPQATVQDLKSRLDWGEPALTIIDVRDRAAFNELHIQGAVSMPLPMLVDAVSRNLEQERDIYVYGDSDEMTATATGQLRAAGFQKVAELAGGLAAWQAAKYPIEG